MSEAPRVYTIKEINKYIRMKMDVDPVLSGVWLRGEISNFTHHSSGHMYFTLKDKDSKLKCVMFASHNAALKFIPREGAKVLARGTISVYERDGAYQFYANAMQPDGIGSLYLAYEQLKGKLEEEGLFAESRKRALPLFPSTIGVVTSPTGAAIRDIITTLKRRYPVANILLYPVQVQGESAAPSIVKAIDTMNRNKLCDVLIVGRGGGSLEELWAFNEEAVARAIADSSIPIISAVGHETDFTIADFVADLRAATPTAAAELAVPQLADLLLNIQRHEQMLQRSLDQLLKHYKDRLHSIRKTPIFSQPKKYLLQQAETLDHLSDSLQHFTRQSLHVHAMKHKELNSKLLRLHPEGKFNVLQKQLSYRQEQLNNVISSLLNHKTMNWHMAVRQLDALSPLKVMTRGYSMAYRDQDKQLLTTVKDVQQGEKINVKLNDGTLNCKILTIEEGQ